MKERLIQKIIESEFKEALSRNKLAVPERIAPGQVLLETGIDSLGFAVLVTVLEDRLGYDPFTLMEEPVYPRTFKEFVDSYLKFRDHFSDEVVD